MPVLDVRAQLWYSNRRTPEDKCGARGANFHAQIVPIIGMLRAKLISGRAEGAIQNSHYRAVEVAVRGGRMRKVSVRLLVIRSAAFTRAGSTDGNESAANPYASENTDANRHNDLGDWRNSICRVRRHEGIRHRSGNDSKRLEREHISLIRRGEGAWYLDGALRQRGAIVRCPGRDDRLGRTLFRSRVWQCDSVS